MLLDPEKDFPPPIELCGQSRIRMKRGLNRPAEFHEILQDDLDILIVRSEDSFIGI
jgi:hypothetical protein